MVLELHIWGPAFSLPSLDPQCIASIAYFGKAVPREQWVLVASSDAGCSPTKKLPALRDGEVVVGGFPNIVDYLRQKSEGDWDLDRHFSDSKDQADITAFTSHILTHAHSLLSLSLYVSSENYASTTRPSYSQFLPWPTQYYIPPQHRSHAKTRTQHLGLSSLDLDTIDGEEERSRRKLADVVPAALRTSRQTLTGLVKQKQSSKRFKLDALVDAACEPLEQLLGEKRCLLSEKWWSSLDCLALGYLALALKPDVPQKWLQEGLRERYPGLCAFFDRGVEECFGGEVRVEDALLGERSSEAAAVTERRAQTTLPWRAPEQSGLHAAGTTMLNAALDTLPFYHSTILAPPPPPPSSENNIPLTTTSAPPSALFPTIIAASTAVAAAAGYLLYTTFNDKGPEKRRLEDMGEAGAMLAAVDFGGVDVAVQEKGL